MWYSFIDGRVLVMLLIVGALWFNYWISDEYAERKQHERDRKKGGV